LANQWGRDSEFRSGRRGVSPALSIIAVILSLVVGAAGGYAAFRFTQSAIEAGIDDAQVDQLRTRIASQARELDAMTERLATITSETLAAEDATSAVDTLTRERDTLAAENQTLRANLARLEAEQSAVSQDASDAEGQIAAELARLQNEVLPELTAERDQLKRKTLIMLSDQGALKARAKVAADTHTYDAKRITDLQARLADAEQELAASQEVLDALKLEKRTVQTSKIVADSAETDPVKQPDADENPALELREPDAVAQALRTAPGLETLSDADRQKLTDTLVSGECVTTALKSVFARVPILTLRSLIRDLNSDC